MDSLASTSTATSRRVYSERTKLRKSRMTMSRSTTAKSEGCRVTMTWLFSSVVEKLTRTSVTLEWRSRSGAASSEV